MHVANMASHVAANAGEALPPPDALCILVGNSKVLWPHVRDDVHRGLPDPIDRHAMGSLQHALTEAQRAAGATEHRISVVPTYAKPFVDFLGLSEAGGLAKQIPGIYLLWHRIYGTWFALRFCLVCPDLKFGDLCPRQILEPLQNHWKQTCDAFSEKAAGVSGGWPKLDLASSMSAETLIALRDRCCTDEQHSAWRYPSDMVRYHYHLGVADVSS